MSKEPSNLGRLEYSNTEGACDSRLPAWAAAFPIGHILQALLRSLLPQYIPRLPLRTAHVILYDDARG